MERLQKRCFVVSAGAHGVLALVLVSGAAFVAPRVQNARPGKPTQGEPAVIQLLQPPAELEAPPSLSKPAEAVARPVSAPEMRTAPPRLTSTPNLVEDVQRLKPAPTGWMPSGTRTPRGPQISTNLVTRPSGSSASMRRPTTGQPGAENYLQAVDRIFQGLSSGTTLDLDFAGNDAGAADYAQYVKDVYTQRWNPSEVDATSEATARVTVTIASDGRVVSRRILTPSGDARMDQSVQRVLDRVTFIRPFDAGSNQKERTYTMNFNLRTKWN